MHFCFFSAQQINCFHHILTKIHLNFHRNGGINPIFAQELHRLHIENVVTEALQEAKLSVSDVDAIAVTNRPGNSI